MRHSTRWGICSMDRRQGIAAAIMLVLGAAATVWIATVDTRPHTDGTGRVCTPVRTNQVLEADLDATCRHWPALTMETLGTVAYGDFQAPIWHIAFAPAGRVEQRVLLTGGVHGDEPAGTAALIAFVERLAREPERFAHTAFDLIPLVNPWGWVHNRRRNGANADINRDFVRFAQQETRIVRDFLAGRAYDLAVDLHEDDEAKGFYLYQIANTKTALSRAIIAAQRDRGYAIAQDVRMVIFKTRDGLIRAPLWSLHAASFGRRQSLINYARLQGHEDAFLIETPSRQRFADRVRMHATALDMLLDDLHRDTP